MQVKTKPKKIEEGQANKKRKKKPKPNNDLQKLHRKQQIEKHEHY